MEISNALVDLAMFPIWDIPSQLRSAQDLLTAASLGLEQHREEDAFVTDSQV
jgi:hypothetical protein